MKTNSLKTFSYKSADKKIKITEADREVMELEEACNKYEKEYTELRAQTGKYYGRNFL